MSVRSQSNALVVLNGPSGRAIIRYWSSNRNARHEVSRSDGCEQQ
jgi:hypothetical protein